MVPPLSRLSCTYEIRALGVGTQAGWITTTQRGRDDLGSGKAMQQQQMTAWTRARLGEANRTEQRQGNGRWGRWFADCREDIKMIRNRWRWISVISAEWHENDGIFNANAMAEMIVWSSSNNETMVFARALKTARKSRVNMASRRGSSGQDMWSMNMGTEVWSKTGNGIE